MGSSRIIATRRRNVLMAHICSECKFPVITVVQIESEAQKTYSFSQTKAEQIAGKTADDAIEHEIRRIENCRHTKTVLISKEKKGSMIAPGHFCDSSISGFEGPCPYCANIEPWQDSSKMLAEKTMRKISELNDDSFPIVFKESNDAEQWAQDCVSKLMKKIEEKRNDILLVEQSLTKSVESTKRIQLWQQQLIEIPELKDSEKIKNELQQYRIRKKQLGLLDFKGKKEVNSSIKILELKLEDVNKIISRKMKPINDNIKREQEELLHNQAIAFGLTGNIVVKKQGMSFSYFYEPNRIPEELILTPSKDDLTEEENSVVINEPNEQSEKRHDKINFCRKCGFKLIPDSAFCTKCGSKVD